MIARIRAFLRAGRRGLDTSEQRVSLELGADLNFGG